MARVLRRATHAEPDHRYASADAMIGTILALRAEAMPDDPPTRRAYGSGLFEREEITTPQTSASRASPFGKNGDLS